MHRDKFSVIVCSWLFFGFAVVVLMVLVLASVILDARLMVAIFSGGRIIFCTIIPPFLTIKLRFIRDQFTQEQGCLRSLTTSHHSLFTCSINIVRTVISCLSLAFTCHDRTSKSSTELHVFHWFCLYLDKATKGSTGPLHCSLSAHITRWLILPPPPYLL